MFSNGYGFRTDTNYKNKKQYVIEKGKKRLVKKDDSEYREWPDITTYMEDLQK